MNPEKIPNVKTEKARWLSMPHPLTWTTIVMILIVAALLVIASRRHDGTLTNGLRSSLVMFRNTAPLFLLGVVAAGLLTALIPGEAGGGIPKSISLTSLLFVVLAAICMVIAYQRRDGSLAEGLLGSWKMFSETWLLLVVAWIFAGYISVLLPEQFVSEWLGRQSGMRGILVACVAGGFTPGGLFVSLPIVAGLIRAGAGEGVIVAYLSAWSLYAFGRLPFEISFMGPRLTAIRFASVFAFPPLAGVIAKLLFER